MKKSPNISYNKNKLLVICLITTKTITTIKAKMTNKKILYKNSFKYNLKTQ